MGWLNDDPAQFSPVWLVLKPPRADSTALLPLDKAMHPPVINPSGHISKDAGHLLVGHSSGFDPHLQLWAHTQYSYADEI
jgi:hypothetical protein